MLHSKAAAAPKEFWCTSLRFDTCPFWLDPHGFWDENLVAQLKGCLRLGKDVDSSIPQPFRKLEAQQSKEPARLPLQPSAPKVQSRSCGPPSVGPHFGILARILQHRHQPASSMQVPIVQIPLKKVYQPILEAHEGKSLWKLGGKFRRGASTLDSSRGSRLTHPGSPLPVSLGTLNPSSYPWGGSGGDGVQIQKTECDNCIYLYLYLYLHVYTCFWHMGQ